MKFYNYIKEARRNPELNPKIGIVEYLYPYKDKQNCFVQFSNINKLGINPKSTFYTPIGIYSYPLRQVWDEILSDDIPFAGDRKYCILFTCSNPMLIECDEYFKSMLIEDLEFYKKEVLEKHQIKIKYETLYNLAKHSAFNDHPFNIFWNFTKELANNITYENISNFSHKRSIVWSDLLRMRNYIGFTDRKGKGYIHPNEPTQAVFLSKEKLKLIDSIPNKRYKQPEQIKNVILINNFNQLIGMETIPYNSPEFKKMTPDKLATFLICNFHDGFETDSTIYKLQKNTSINGLVLFLFAWKKRNISSEKEFNNFIISCVGPIINCIEKMSLKIDWYGFYYSFFDIFKKMYPKTLKKYWETIDNKQLIKKIGNSSYNYFLEDIITKLKV